MNNDINEIILIENMIRILAKRKYINKSELIKLQLGCRTEAISLDKIESIMFSIIGNDVVYHDDVALLHRHDLVFSLQNELEKINKKSIYEYLNLPNDATVEMIILKLKEKNDKKIDEEHIINDLISIIMSNNLRLFYDMHLHTQEVWNEMRIRRRFGFNLIEVNEYDNYIKQLMLSLCVSDDTAAELLSEGLNEYDITVQNEKIIHEKLGSQKQYDEYMVEVPNANIEKEHNTEDITKNK